MNPRTGRHLTTAVTLLVLTLVLCGMAIWGWRQATAPFNTAKSTSPQSCSPAEITVIRFARPRDVQVSVFNAGHNSGLAGRTMTRLEMRGFEPGEVGNAPSGLKVRHVVVHTTKKDDPQAQLVAQQLGRHVRVIVTGKELGPGVDVFVGNHFHGLRKHAPRKVKLPKPIRQCVPVS